MAEFRTTDLEYDLPADRIAQTPALRRDESRLLVVPRQGDAFTDRTFSELPDLLRPADVLVLNDTRVVPARLVARRSTGGRFEGLFLREVEPGRWEVMIKGRGRLRSGERLQLAEPSQAGDPPSLTLEAPLGNGAWQTTVEPPENAEAILRRVGHPPLPPYIRRTAGGDSHEPVDRERYQTVYAANAGAVAAPTAGLHFTDRLLERIRSLGVALTHVTLRVGIGTFAPIKAEKLGDHGMHAEWYNLPEKATEMIAQRRTAGGRVVAVGTTSLRVLESCVTDDGMLRPGFGWTRLFCYPPYPFRAVDALVTNFHLPRSTLLALVMAFAGVERTRRAYAHAIAHGYRFYSYGDAMFIG